MNCYPWPKPVEEASNQSGRAAEYLFRELGLEFQVAATVQRCIRVDQARIPLSKAPAWWYSGQNA
jgi:hypothetical protein